LPRREGKNCKEKTGEKNIECLRLKFQIQKTKKQRNVVQKIDYLSFIPPFHAAALIACSFAFSKKKKKEKISSGRVLLIHFLEGFLGKKKKKAHTASSAGRAVAIWAEQ
jgi:hypothetical protein